MHCKCRPDSVNPAGNGGVILLDLKTCQDASAEGFPKSIARHGYHLQAAWYSDGYERASGQKVLGFVFACVESESPHAAAAYMLDDESLDKARAEVRRLLQPLCRLPRGRCVARVSGRRPAAGAPAWA